MALQVALDYLTQRRKDAELAVGWVLAPIFGVVSKMGEPPSGRTTHPTVSSGSEEDSPQRTQRRVEMGYSESRMTRYPMTNDCCSCWSLLFVSLFLCGSKRNPAGVALQVALDYLTQRRKDAELAVGWVLARIFGIVSKMGEPPSGRTTHPTVSSGSEEDSPQRTQRRVETGYSE